MSKLTAKRVANAPTKDKEYLIHDGLGLFLRVRPSSVKSWLFSFRLAGNSRTYRMTLGSVESISLKEARDMLRDLHKLVSQGIDPRNARAAAITENSQAITMQSLFDAWIDFLKSTNTVTHEWIKSHQGRWQIHLKSSLGNIFAKDVTRAHLANVLDNMSRKGIKEETRKALTTLNLMLDYGLTRHMVEQNPARVLKPKDFAASANRGRDRVLALAELRKLWTALDWAVSEREGIAKTSLMNFVTATAIKMLILTGARRGEVAAMRWDEVDLKAGTWIIPSQKTKNRQSHTIFLSTLSVALLEQLNPVTGQSNFVFDTGLNSNGHIHTDALTRAIRRLRVKDKIKEVPKKNSTTDSDEKKKTQPIEKVEPPLHDMKPFTAHDIRRSAATAWGGHLKIKPHIIERMLNHQPLNKLVAVYQRATYEDEQKVAWNAWGELVEHQIANNYENIICIKKANH